MESGIYRIRNLVNDKIYIGQAFNLSDRNADHFSALNSGLHHNRHLQRAYNKYGRENFVFEILEYCEKEFLTKQEQKYVDENPEAYNICKVCVTSPLGTKRTEETKQRMSELKKGTIVSELTKYKISLAAKGRPNPHTKEWNEKIGKSNTISIKRPHSEVCAVETWIEAMARFDRQDRDIELNEQKLNKIPLYEYSKGWCI